MTTRSLVVIVAVVVLTYATRSFVPRGATVTGSGALLAFGLLLVTAVMAARIFAAMKLPRLTAYMVCGILFGPGILSLVSQKMLPDLAMIKGTAVGLIAFLAGCELNFRALRPRMRALGALTVLSVGGAVIVLFLLFYGMTYVLPIAAEFTQLQRLVFALICANAMGAFSPAAVIAILAETKARGPLAETTMAVVVLADLIIVVSFALSSTFGHTVFQSGAQQGGGFAVLVPHIFGSAVAGIIAGAILATYSARIGTRTGLFTFAVLFVAAEAGRALHLDPLLLGLAAGLFLENVTPEAAERIRHAAEDVTMPVFAIFFAVIGAEVQLTAFLHVAPFALLAAMVRALGIWGGVKLASRRAEIDAVFARRLTVGLVSQAGVAIALAALLLRDFNPWGAVAGTLLLGSIVVNQILGPVLFRNALVAAGEATAVSSSPSAPE